MQIYNNSKAIYNKKSKIRANISVASAKAKPKRTYEKKTICPLKE